MPEHLTMSEKTEPTYPHRPSTFVSYGLPFAELTKIHLDKLGAKTAYVLVSGSLQKHHPEQLDALRKKLGNRIVGERIGVEGHSPWSNILNIATETTKVNPKAFITLGGGSICDATKVLVLIDANRPQDGEYTHEYLQTLSPQGGDDYKPANIKSPTRPIICIPTTLSAAEYNSSAGAVDDRTHHKRQFTHPECAPKVVILDAGLARLTPEWVWISTGVRAIDHCVETLCSPQCDETAEASATDGLAKLVSGLIQTKTGGDSLDSRLNAHLGAKNAMDAPCRGIPLGGSHGIGHQLGAYNVAHGHTSCVLCPFVMRYNKKVTEEQQKKALKVIWGSSEQVKKILQSRGLEEGKSDLCDVLDAVFRELGMPRSLKEVGVGEDKFAELAEKSLTDRWCATNPIPLTEKGQVMEILRMAA